MTPPNLLTEWARLLLGSLREAGVRDVVVSPGSRNTPFTWAALRDPDLRCRSIIDERDAAFFAVGHARITGDPVLLVCTSGSAAANYFPAVVEAAEAAVPLLVLTADRPLELQAAAAPQTIDQVRLYGRYVRAFIELGTPDADPRALRAVPRLAAQAVLTSRSPVPGPVHLNARARKPLEPVEADAPGLPPEARALSDAVDALLDRVPASAPPELAPAADLLRRLAGDCRAARRGLIVCGPAEPRHAADPEAVAALARATGFPVAAEAASQVRFVDLHGVATVDSLGPALEVRGFAEAHVPDLVIQVGRPPTDAGWNRAFGRWEEGRRWVIAPFDWADPWNRAAGVIRSELTTALDALSRAISDARPDAEPSPGPGPAPSGPSTWRDRLVDVDARARAMIEASIEDEFAEGAAVRAVVDALPRGGVLALGNSLPIREASAFVPRSDRGITVWSQRGANGIDGLIAGAAGAAAAAGRPTTLILGDVSFLHDIGGLAAARDVDGPFLVVVLNNGGGRIFDRLPIAAALAGAPDLDLWLTPPRLDVEAAARAFGLPYDRATDPASLDRALAAPAGRGVLEVVVPAAGTTAHHRDLLRRLATLLTAGDAPAAR